MELNFIKCGDYYIPDLELPEETRPIGIWGRMHKAYLELYHPARYADLILSGQLWTYLAEYPSWQEGTDAKGVSATG